jgi:hypothetical protein
MEELRESVCVCERERECVYVYERERVCERESKIDRGRESCYWHAA